METAATDETADNDAKNEGVTPAACSDPLRVPTVTGRKKV
jgi:hypothetical protein